MITTLYHYVRPEYVLDDIINRRLKISTMDSLNDPYEMLPSLKDANDAWMPIDLMRPRMRDILKYTGMLCLSKTVNSPAMWAHYADKHKGVAFEFTADNCMRDALVEVKYDTNDRVAICPDDNLDSPEEFAKFANELIRRKAPCWQYEEEYRLVYPLRSREVFMDGVRFYVTMPLQLTRLVLGVDCGIGEGVIRRALDDAGLLDVRLGRARMSDSDYSIIID